MQRTESVAFEYQNGSKYGQPVHVASSVYRSLLGHLLSIALMDS